MKCPKCESPMRLLFIHWSCDYCDGGWKPEDQSDRYGFVVLRRARTLPCEEYVFATRADAERWRELNGLFDADIREVRNPLKAFKWQPSRGKVRGIILADSLHEVNHEDGTFHSPFHRAVIVDNNSNT